MPSGALPRSRRQVEDTVGSPESGPPLPGWAAPGSGTANKQTAKVSPKIPTPAPWGDLLETPFLKDQLPSRYEASS